jgi:hypothetical protein
MDPVKFEYTFKASQFYIPGNLFDLKIYSNDYTFKVRTNNIIEARKILKFNVMDPSTWIKIKRKLLIRNF